MKKAKKYKLFRRRTGKRMAAFVMAAVMAFSCLYGAVPYASAGTSLADMPKGGTYAEENKTPGNKPPTFKDKFKATGIKRLTAYKNHLVDKLVDGIAKDIDDATGTDTATKLVSWVNQWVFGKSPIKGTLAAMNTKLDNITKLCNDILKELDEVERQLDSIESHLSRQDITDAKERLDEAWRRDGDMSQISSGSNSVNYEGVGRALDAFLDYMEAAQAYTEAEDAYNKNSSSANKSSLDKAEKAMNKAEDQYEYMIFEIYTNGKHVMFSDALQEDMYTSYDVGDQIVKAIEGLTRKLCGDGITDTYTDYAAQYAYLTKAFTDEQYDFVNTCMQRQLLQICSLEIMYQDYLSRQGDYLLEKHGDDEKLFSGYDYALEIFAKINDEFSIAAADRMEKEIRFNPSSEKTIHLYTYLTSDDTLFYENDRNAMKGTSPVIQKGVLDGDGTVKAFWFTKGTHETAENDDATNKTLRGMHNYEKEVSYTGPIKSFCGITGVVSYAGDLVLLKLGDLYPDDLSAYEVITPDGGWTDRTKDGNSYYSDASYFREKSQYEEKCNAAEKLKDIRSNAVNCNEGKKWNNWISLLFDTTVFSANESYTAQSYLAGDKDLAPLLSGKDGSMIKHLYAGQEYDSDHTQNVLTNSSWYYGYWYTKWMDMGSRPAGGNITLDKLCLFMSDRELQGVYDSGIDYYGIVDTQDKKPFGEDVIDILCANYSSAYQQNIRVRNSSSVRINGKTETTQVNANGTVTLSFDKKSGNKVPMAVRYYHSNMIGDKFTEDALYQDGEVVVDYDEMQAILELDPDADTVEMEIPVRYALNTAYEVVYEEPIGDVENLEFSSDDRYNGKFTISFDKIVNATNANVSISTDEDFTDIIQTDTLDMAKDAKENGRISKTYQINFSKINAVYVRVMGYEDKDYGTILGNEEVKYVISPPSVSANLYSINGDVRVDLSYTYLNLASAYEVQFSPAEDNFEKADTILSKTIDKGSVGIFRLEMDKHYYVRSRAVAKDAQGYTMYGCWSKVFTELYTELGFDKISKLEVLDPPTSVRITTLMASTPYAGYRFVAFSENVPVEKIKEYFSKENPQIDAAYKNDVKYIEIDSTESLTQTFSNLTFMKWYFFVELYALDENGHKMYSNKKEEDVDIAEVDLSPHMRIDEIKITSPDEITVSHIPDYTSTDWTVQVIDHLDGNKVYSEKTASVDVDSMTLKVPRNNGVEVRLSCQLKNPDTGEITEGACETDSGYQPYDSRFVDLGIIQFFNIVDTDTLRVILKDMNEYPEDTRCEIELYLYDDKIYESTAEKKATLDIKELSKEGRYRLKAKPYVTNSDGKKDYLTGGEAVVIYEPPQLESVIMEPDKMIQIIGITGERGVSLPDAVSADMRYKKNGTLYDAGSTTGTYDADDNLWVFNWQAASDTKEVSFKLSSIWHTGRKATSSSGGRGRVPYIDVVSSWTEYLTFTCSDIPQYSSFSEWAEKNRDQISVDIYEYSNATAPPTPTPTMTPSPTPTIKPSPTPYHKPTPTPFHGVRLGPETSPKAQASGLSQSPKTGTVKKAAVNSSSKKKYQLSVKLPKTMETEKDGKLEFDGITVRLTSDEKGENIIARGYGKGRELVIAELPEHNELEEGKDCYIWISPFNYGDDDKKVILNAGYVGPFKVTPHTGTAPAPGQETPKPTAGQKASGLSVGKKAVAGSGAAKAVYKATGKDTVTYQKTKVKKSAKTATVPATVKINGKKYKVTKIAKSAFKGYKNLKTVVVKPKGLKKKKVTGCFNGTSVKIVYVPKKQYKKYKKFFTKKVTKSKVKVKVKKNK